MKDNSIVTQKSEKRTQRDYPLGFKLSVVSEVEKGELTYKQAQDVYGIQGRSTVLTWLRKHGKLDWSTSLTAMGPKKEETPAQKIKRLEKELADERLKTLILDETINYSDKHHGTSLRKKVLPEQLEASNKKNR